MVELAARASSSASPMGSGPTGNGPMVHGRAREAAAPVATIAATALDGPLRRAMERLNAAGAAALRMDAVAQATAVAAVGSCAADGAALAAVARAGGRDGRFDAPRAERPEAGVPLHRLELPCGDAPRFVLSFVRDGGAAPFGPAELRCARQMHDWLADLVAMWWRGREDAAARRGQRAVIDASDAGVVLLDGDARILEANAAAAAMLEAGDGLRRTGPMVTAVTFEDSIKLQTAIHHAIAAARDGDPKAGGRAALVSVRRRGKRPLAVAVVPILGTAEPGSPLSFLQVTDPDAGNDHLVAPACAAFGLTGAEARLARQLAGGATLAEASERLKVQPETVKAYLKQIFHKTGVNRQAALVQLLLLSQARLRAGIEVVAV